MRRSTMTHVPEEKSFSGEAATLNYLDWGPPFAEPLVMLHGGAWSWQEYVSLIPSLAETRHVYALDFRGNGRSEWVPDAYRLQDFAQDNAEFLGQLEAPAVLVGHSLGAVVALMLAGRFPDRVKALILEDPAITLENYRKVIDSSGDMFRVWLGLKKRVQSEHELAVLLAKEYAGYPGATSTWLLYFARCLWQLDPTFFNAMLRDFDEFAVGCDGKQLLESLACPVLCLHGESRLGAVMTEGEISWLQKTCRNVKCVQIGGVGHLLHLESQAQKPVLTAMLNFLTELGAAPTGGPAKHVPDSGAGEGPPSVS
jgi:pimeloyl-ACP methyl ester carboxylesterase